MSSTNSVSVVVSGKIKLLSNKKWKQRFCVVAKTDFAGSVKLFVYKEASDYKKSADLSAQAPYDTVYGLDSVSSSDKSPVMAAIVLTCEDRLVLLGFNSYSDLTFWLEKISNCVQDASYRARFIKCESIGKPTQQQLCPSGGGGGRLHVQPSRLCFYSEPADSHGGLAVWPLQFIKRYMVNEAMRCFVFEGDVGCGQVRGMQYFQCDRRHQLYLDMKAACVSKPLPSLAQGCTVEVADPRRPTASSSIDIPKPRADSQQQPEPGTGNRCRHRCASRRLWDLQRCRCRCHNPAAGQVSGEEQQLKAQQQLGQWTADSGYSGGLPSYFTLCTLLKPCGSRDYCNLPAGVGSAPPTAAAAMSKLRLASLTWRRRQNSQQADPPGPANGYRRLVRSSSDLCGSASSCCSSCGCRSNCRDPAADGGFSSSGSAATSDDFRVRNPRHGFEYVSRQRVASLSAASGCHASLPNPAPLSKKPTESAARRPADPCRSAPSATSAAGDTSTLLYATLDHSAAAAQPALAMASATPAAAGAPQLNYTEVDHWKTGAFREIAEQLDGSRRLQQQQHGRSNSGSASGTSGHRRSFIRMFQRGHSFRQD
ncbi:hypothetical protein BOX15_Mlig032442g3 [Macrostomum lignano]|uniref:PH domain-containing protein n=2 Tax=Macrostomum lignano TaxID=282301 RepID=A0A267FWS7_9PLAT|nr:hypothetical protein BOX15_Mlig032442g3 [Macrostomum lignano]